MSKYKGKYQFTINFGSSSWFSCEGISSVKFGSEESLISGFEGLVFDFTIFREKWMD